MRFGERVDPVLEVRVADPGLGGVLELGVPTRTAVAVMGFQARRIIRGVVVCVGDVAVSRSLNRRVTVTRPGVFNKQRLTASSGLTPNAAPWSPVRICIEYFNFNRSL